MHHNNEQSTPPHLQIVEERVFDAAQQHDGVAVCIRQHELRSRGR
jgi:hypothetical protein